MQLTLCTLIVFRILNGLNLGCIDLFVFLSPWKPLIADTCLMSVLKSLKSLKSAHNKLKEATCLQETMIQRRRSAAYGGCQKHGLKSLCGSCSVLGTMSFSLLVDEHGGAML